MSRNIHLKLTATDYVHSCGRLQGLWKITGAVEDYRGCGRLQGLWKITGALEAVGVQTSTLFGL